MLQRKRSNIDWGATYDNAAACLEQAARWAGVAPSEVEFADYHRVIRMKGTKVEVAHMDFDQGCYVKVINGPATAES